MAVRSGFSQQDLVKMAPSDIERKRRLAEALIASGADTRPIGHWTQGAARLAQALAGKIQESRLDKAEKAGRAEANKAVSGVNWGAIFGGDQTPAASSASQPSFGSSPASGASVESVAGAATPEAETIQKGLIDRGLPKHVAEAFVMNFQDESGLNPGINEKNPIVPGSRGGYGLYQLTGPRRVAYEQFAAQRGVDPSNTDAQLDFLMMELQGPEKKAAQSILSAPDTGSAAAAIARDFLRPAKEHLDRRVAKYLQRGGGGEVQVASLDPSIGVAGGEQPFVTTLPNRAGPIDPATAVQTLPDRTAGAQIDPSQMVTPLGYAPTQAGAQDPAAQFYGTAPDKPLSEEERAARRARQAEIDPLFTDPPRQQKNPFAEILIKGGAGAKSPASDNQKIAAALLQGSPANAGFSQQAIAAHDAAFGGALAPNGASAPQNQKIAQALIGGGQGTDYFPPAPGAAGNTAQTQAQPSAQENIQQLIGVLNHPFATREQKMMAIQALETLQQRNDPLRQMQLQKGQLEIEALRAKPQTEYGFTTLPDGTVLRTDKRSGNAEPIYSAGQKPTIDMQEYEFAKSQGFQGTFAEYQQAMKKAGATNVTQNAGGNSSKFIEESDKAAAGRMNDYVTAGTSASQMMSDMEQLLALGTQIGTGKEAEIKLALGPYAEMFGVNIDGLGEAQAFKSITDRLAPQMRPTGSGASSDTDVRMFLNSLPNLRNTPEGNQIIANTMRGIAQNKMQAAEIAARAQAGEMSWQDAEKLIRALPNPYENFKAFQKQAKGEGGKRTSTGVQWSIEP